MSTEVGSASVRIDPDLSYFRDELAAKLEEASVGLHEEIKVTADTSSADAKLLATKVLAESIGSTSLSGGSAGNAGSLAALEAQKAIRDAEQATLKATQDLASGWQLLDNNGHSLSGVLSGMPGILGDLGKAMSDVGDGGGQSFMKAISGVSEDVPFMAIGIATLVAALIPVAAVATGAAGALTTMLSASLFGVGAFALAAAGQFGDFTTTLKNDLASWQQSLSGFTKPVVSELTGVIGPALSSLSPLVVATSAALTPLIKSFKQDFLQGPEWAGFVGFLSGSVGPALVSLGAFVENIMVGFQNMAEVGAPFMVTVENGLVSLSASFLKFSEGQGFKSFVDYVIQEGPVVGAFFEGLLGTTMHLLVALAPLGDAVLKIFTAAFDIINPLLPLVDALATMIDKTVGPVADLVAQAMQLVNATEAAGLSSGHAAQKAGFWSSALHDVTREVMIHLPMLQSHASATGASADATGHLETATQRATTALEAEHYTATQATAFIKAMGDQHLTTAQIVDASLTALGAKIGVTGAQFKTLQDQSGKTGAAMIAALDTSARQAGTTATALDHMALSGGMSFKQIAADAVAAGKTTGNSWTAAGDMVTHFAGQTNVTQGQISQFYSLSVLNASSFSSNIQKAIQAGYNPTLIQQMLEAGPAKAAPTLAAMVAGAGTNFETLVNASVSALSTLNAQAVQESRLTQFAIDANSSSMTADLGTALQISQNLVANGSKSTVAEVIANISGGLPQVQAVAEEYGIALPTALTKHTPDHKTAGQNLAGQFAAGLDTGIEKVATSSQAMNDKVLEKLNKGPAEANGIGRMISDGLAKGITANSYLISQAASAATQAAIDAAKKKAGTQSPSTVARDEIGLPFVQGIAVGILGNLSLLENASATAVNSLSQSVNVAAAGRVSVGSATASTATNHSSPVMITSAPVIHIDGSGLNPDELQASITKALSEHDEQLLALMTAHEPALVTL